MQRQFRKIIKAFVKYNGGFFGNNIVVTPTQISVKYADYTFLFKLLDGKPFGAFAIIHTAVHQVYDLTFESGYNSMGYFDRTFVNYLFTATTDNHDYIKRVIDGFIFPTV